MKILKILRKLMLKLVLMKQQNNGMPLLVTKDEKYICDPIPIANTFNKFFTSVAETVPSKNQIFK